MPITAPPAIPQITDPATFSVRAQDWVVWQAEQLYPELVAQSALLGLSLSGTSVTSNTIGTGSKSFTVQTGKGFAAGQSIVIARTSAPTNRMFCVVTSYNSGTGALVVTSQAFEGAGTFTDWTISPTLNAVLTAAQVPDGLITTNKIADDQVTLSKLDKSAKTDKIQPITASVASNALTITLNPTTLDFRSSTLGSGTVNTRTVSAAISVVVSSGSTLGTVNGVDNRLAVLAIDNAGTVELAVVNVAGGTNLDETGVISTTAEGGAGNADSASVIYSTTARTNVPYRVVGFVESTQTTAGTWATAPSKVQGFGGQAFAYMSSIGYNQTWQDVTASRANNTTYTNTTGRPILVSVYSGLNSLAAAVYTFTINGLQVQRYQVGQAGNGVGSGGCVGTVVPAGATYSASVPGLTNWLELR